MTMKCSWERNAPKDCGKNKKVGYDKDGFYKCVQKAPEKVCATYRKVEGDKCEDICDKGFYKSQYI